MLRAPTCRTRWAAVCLLCLALASPAAGQTAGSLRGTVTDPSGAVVPGATLLLTNDATRTARQAVSDAAGRYYFAATEAGDYTLRVELAGFRIREVRGIHLSPSDTRGVDVALELGPQTETVDVVATQDLISTETGARESLLTAQQIDDLPTIGRNPLELIRILPGTVPPNQNAMAVAGKTSGASSTAGTTVNGVRGANMQVSLDGARLQDIGSNNGTLIVLNNEMVSEVKLQTSNYAAEFGSPAISVQAVTKSGAARFHAELYDSVRDHGLGTNEQINTRIGGQKPATHFQFPGVIVSGPVLIPGTRFNRRRDKLFFFVGAEINRQTIDQGTSFSIVPTLGQRQGRFDDYQGGQNLNQAPTVLIPSGYPGAGTPAPNNDLRPYLDPTGARLLSLWPLPNFVDGANRYNYVFDDLASLNRDQELIRLDYNLSSATRLYVRGARDWETGTRSLGLWSNTSAVALPTPVKATSLGWSVAVNGRSVLSSTMTNEAVASWSRLKHDNRWDDPAKMSLATYGIDGFTNPLGASRYVPQLVMQNSGGTLSSMGDVDNVFAYSSFASLADNVTWVRKAHALKAGVVLERWQKQQNLPNAANGRLSFDVNAPGSTGVDFGDVLVGRPYSAVVGTPSAVGTFVSWAAEAFAQDSWRINRHVTLEYGVRFGRWTNNEETQGLGAVFQPSRYDTGAGLFLDAARTRLNGLAYAKTGDVTRALTAPRPWLWMPRVSAVWNLDGGGRTVVRGGAGVFYNREQGNAQYGVVSLPPNAYAATLNAASWTDLGGGRGLTYTTLGQADPFSARNGVNINTVSPTALDWPTLVSTSVSVARRLPGRQMLEVGYVGSFGRHLAEQQNVNVIAPGTLLHGTLGNADLSVPVNRVALDTSAVNTRRPFAALQNVTNFVPAGTSTYHSLQTTIKGQSRRFQYLLAYTLSRSVGTLGSDLGTIDPIDPTHRSYGFLPTDRTHVANFSWTWRLGELVSTGRIRRALLNGWDLSGISTLMSGSPIRLTFTGDIAGSAMSVAWWGTPDHPNPVFPVYTCDPRRTTSSGAFLDIGCIGIPAFGRSGEMVQPYYLRAPSSSFHDLVLVKSFRVRVKKKSTTVQLRAGIFNLFNQAFPTVAGDVDLALDTRCNVRVNGVPNGAGGIRDNVCDPTGGFSFTPQTLQNFATAIARRGHRDVSLNVKLIF
jgi:hypothetical protein